MPDNFPSIGEPVLDPSEKFAENGVDKYDLPIADGGLIDEVTHPALYRKYATSTYEEEGTLTASDAAYKDLFGVSTSVYGDRLVVGAPDEGTAALGGGKVYIYDWNGSIYVEVGQLTASDASSGDRFGFSTSVYGDRLVVGALFESTATTEAGKVYIYDWNGSIYVEVGKLTASDASSGDRFGRSTSVYGGRLVVGATDEDTAATDGGKVYIYDWNGSTYTEIGQLTASDAAYKDFFGVSASVYGDRLVVGAPNEDTATTDAGKVYIYDESITANRPTMTSPDPLCPYRIVADLT